MLPLAAPCCLQMILGNTGFEAASISHQPSNADILMRGVRSVKSFGSLLRGGSGGGVSGGGTPGGSGAAGGGTPSGSGDWASAASAGGTPRQTPTRPRLSEAAVAEGEDGEEDEEEEDGLEAGRKGERRQAAAGGQGS